MFLDPFDNLTDQEAKLEQRNIFKMWEAIPLEAKKGIVKYQWKYGK